MDERREEVEEEEGQEKREERMEEQQCEVHDTNRKYGYVQQQWNDTATHYTANTVSINRQYTAVREK